MSAGQAMAGPYCLLLNQLLVCPGGVGTPVQNGPCTQDFERACAYIDPDVVRSAQVAYAA